MPRHPGLRCHRLLRSACSLRLLLQTRQQLACQRPQPRILILPGRCPVKGKGLIQSLGLRLRMAPGELLAVQRCQAIQHGAMLAALVQIALTASATAIRCQLRAGEIQDDELAAIHSIVHQLANGLEDMLPADMVHRIRAAGDLFP